MTLPFFLKFDSADWDAEVIVVEKTISIKLYISEKRFCVLVFAWCFSDVSSRAIFSIFIFQFSTLNGQLYCNYLINILTDLKD